MAQPPGNEDLATLNHVCLLHMAIYGVKLAPRAWFERFTTQLFHLGFIATTTNINLFILTQDNHVVYLVLYVYDIIIIGNHPSFIS